MKWIFGERGGRTPRALFNTIYPGVSPQAIERMKDILEHGRWCQPGDDTGLTASLCVRKISGILKLQLQCNVCGNSMGGQLKRDDFPKWELYPAWDDELPECYRDASDEFYDKLRRDMREASAKQRTSAEILLEKRRKYVETLSTPEWRYLRERVHLRAKHTCEACLNAQSTVVHHLTYGHGVYPPAWELRALCRPCHDRLHSASDEWCCGIGQLNE